MWAGVAVWTWICINKKLRVLSTQQSLGYYWSGFRLNMQQKSETRLWHWFTCSGALGVLGCRFWQAEHWDSTWMPVWLHSLEFRQASVASLWHLNSQLRVLEKYRNKIGMPVIWHSLPPAHWTRAHIHRSLLLVILLLGLGRISSSWGVPFCITVSECRAVCLLL